MSYERWSSDRWQPNRVHGRGKTPCDVMLIGSAPGWQEDKFGVPFAGNTGDELRRILSDDDDLPDPSDIFLTNLYREYRGKDYIYTAEDLERDSIDLRAEVQRCRPKLIITLGREASRFFLGDVDIEDVHGLPWKVSICYACLEHGTGVLDTSEQNEQLLVVDRMRTESRVRLSNVPLQELVGSSASLHVRQRTDTGDNGPRPSVLQSTMRQPRPSGDSFGTREQPTRKGAAPSVSSRTSVHGRKHATHQGRGSEVSRVRTISEAASGCCQKCSGPLSGVVIFGMYHIAAGFQNPDLNAHVAYDFSQLAAFRRGELKPRKLYDDPLKGTETYEEITELQQLDGVLRRRRREDGLDIDTEGSPAHPWSLQFSFGPGHGYCIRTGRTDLIRRFGTYLVRTRPRLAFHNALHDLRMLRALDLPLDLPFDDTMVMAYLLQVEPQGLKPLATRHCNMRMQSYDSVLGEAPQRLAHQYINALWELETLEHEEKGIDALMVELEKGRRIQNVPKVPKTPLHKACERGLRSKNVRRWWKNQVEDIHVAAYNRLGEMPYPTLDVVPLEKALRYACRDPDATNRVRAELEPRVQSMQLGAVYQLEMSTYPLIARMQHVGLRPDLPHFARLSERLSLELEDVQATLVAATGNSDFNANSGDQVADYLFDELGLDGYKKTSKGRFSTNDKVLEALEREHADLPVISTIRNYREYYKLKHTFVDRLPDFVKRWPFDGRVHADFRTTRVVTGRLAASDPNVLAMPKHGKFAKDFRRGWVPADGRRLCEWDLSQIELRVLAHLSQDPLMLAIFRGEMLDKNGKKIDLHAALAERIFGVPPHQQHKSKHRLPAKAVNFGIPMGMTCHGLMLELRKNGVDIDLDDAQRWLDETLGLYKGIQPYMDSCIAEAEQHGYIRCMSGRIRYIGGIRSRDDRLRSEAERFSFSTKIQEGAQKLVKEAEARIWDMLQVYWRAGIDVEPLIQVHDALTLECTDDPALARDLNQQMVHIMTQTPPGFSVPVETSGDWGYNWCDQIFDDDGRLVDNEEGMRPFKEAA